MPADFWKAVKRVIREADVLLLLLDARFVDESRNSEVEEKVRSMGKPLIYVITKTDMADRRKLEDYRKLLRPLVFFSARDREGRTRLKERIFIEAERKYGGLDKIYVGVLGYPNVGKSSLINYMKGRHSAPTSPHSGYTKSNRLVKAETRLYFVDTPGVIPYGEKDEIKHVSMNVIDSTKVKDPDMVVTGFMRKYPGKIEAHYGVPAGEDKQKTLGEIALKMNVLRKGGVPDIERVSRAILKDFQAGKIRI